MKKAFRLISLVIVLTSCTDDGDFSFTPRHRNLFNNYKIGDTIYFSNSYGDYDTILIASIDSQQVSSKITDAHKYVQVEIKHLPENNWTGGREVNMNDNSFKVINQDLISVDKQLKNPNEEEKYSIHFAFRNLRGELTDIKSQRSDNLFSGLNIKTYWQIDDYSSSGEDSSLITKILWTEKYGLTGYYKGTSDFYKIRPK